MSLSPLLLDPLIRETWGQFDPLAIAQLEPLSQDECYQPKLYKAPETGVEVVPPGGYIEFGLTITPGSLIYGFYLPVDPNTGLPGPFTVPIEDLSLQHKFFDEPVPSVFLSNSKPDYLDAFAAVQSCAVNLLNPVYPVVGSGLFRVQLQNTSADPQRIELIFGVLEVMR